MLTVSTFFPTELLVFLECWPTGKEFRLPWHSFVRIENRLSINKKCRQCGPWIFHSEVVRASAWRTRGREFESRTIHFLYQSFLFFLFPCLSFICLNFEVKQCANIYIERRICNGIEVMPFYFYFCSYPTYDKGTIRHIAWLSSFLFKIQCFYQVENDLAPDYQTLNKREKEHFVFLQHFWRPITLAAIDVLAFSTESQVLFSFIIRVMMDTPIFYFIIFFW